MAINYTALGLALPDDGTTGWGDEYRDSMNALSAILSERELVNGVMTGLEATDGGSLQVDYSAGTAWVSGCFYNISASNLTATGVTGSETLKRNFVSVSAAGAVQISTSIPTAAVALIAIVDCTASAISAIYDLRQVPIVRQNLIRNPGFDVSQKYGTGYASDSDILNQAAYSYMTADRWGFLNTSDATMKIYSARTGSAYYPTQLESGAVVTRGMTIENTTHDDSIGASQYSFIVHKMDENYSRQLSGKKTRLSFWTKCGLAGTYSVSINISSKSFVTTFDISSADVTTGWVKKFVTIDFDPSISMAGVSVRIRWFLSCGSTYHAPSLDEWNTGTYYAAAAQANYHATAVGTTPFMIAQPKLEIGDEATPFSQGEYSEELEFCRQYYQKIVQPGGTGYYGGTGINYGTTLAEIPIILKEPMVSVDEIETSGSFSLLDSGGIHSATSVNQSVGDFPMSFDLRSVWIACVSADSLTPGPTILRTTSGASIEFWSYSS